MPRIRSTTVGDGQQVKRVRHASTTRQPSTTSPASDLRDAGSGPTASRWQPLRTWILQAGTSGLILAVVLHLRYGYSAGDRDHTVLTPLGMQWAHPEWFAGDWAIANAPQPHWMFDVLTWFGAATNTLAAVYLVYWLLAMAVFGIATTLVARAWTPRYVWIAIIAVSLFAGVSPSNALGTGSAMFATALPNVLGGSLLYLTCAALLLNRHRIAAVAGVATAFIHVQQGAVTAVLLGAMAVALYLRARRAGEARRWDRTLIIGAVLALGVVYTELKIRPVAGHISDFAEACREIIPYHCDASTWSRAYVLGGFAMIGLALATIVFLAREQWLRWFVVLALPAAGLVVGLVANKLDVPVLGEFAQGVNVYRLMLIFLPFALWGILTPIFGELAPRARWLVLGLVLALGQFALQLAWAVDSTNTLRASLVDLAFGGALVLACVALTVPEITSHPRGVVRVAGLGLIFSLVASMIVGHAISMVKFDPRIYPRDADAEWGDQVQALVPPGHEILVPPDAWTMRMMTKRAVVVDCKYGPYGGDPWREFKSRIDQLGGFGQCLGTKGATLYEDLSGETLANVAGKYGADYIVVRSAFLPENANRRESRVPPRPETDDPEQTPVSQARALLDQGWTVILGPSVEMPFYLLARTGT